MIEKALSPASIQSMLQTLRAAQVQAQDGVELPKTIQAPGQQAPAGFAQLVRHAVGEVNELQQNARTLQSAYEQGQVPLTDVVLGMQKSSLAFEATLQVRNKVLKAYEDILNMPV
jgi:flagellar hook-basal body complex protein FliE